MQELDLILTLAGSLAAALVCGYVTLRLGLSPIVGYLLAGLVVGPYTPGFVANGHLAEQFAELGVVLMMFGVGLQFDVRELLAVRRVAVPGALARSAAATVLGALVGLAQGWGWPAAVVFGLALSIASTVVLLRVLADSGDLHTPAGHIAVGWLVVEDLLTVLVLVLLPAVFGAGAGPGGIVVAVVVALAKVAAMVVLTFVLGDRLIPWLLERAAATRSRELFTLAVLVLALGIAVGSARFFGVSMALGAFLAGMVVARTEFSLRAATEALPMRDAFAVLFFVAVGILFHPRFLLQAPGLVAATLAVVLVAKPLVALALLLWLGQPLRTALAVALATAQIGEFSFIMATVGGRLGIVGDAERNALIAAAIVSITLNPLLYRLVGPLERLLRGLVKTTAAGRAPAGEGARPGARHRAVIVGYGPVGQTLARLLRANRIEPVVVELNVETVRRLKHEGTDAVYGDAAHRETLESAGAAGAVALVLSSSDMQGAAEAVRWARTLNPMLAIFARAAYLAEAADLRRAGADLVFSGEGEVALAMTESVLRQLGATPEQIDRERDRIRADLFGDARPVDALPDDRTMAAVTTDRAESDRSREEP